MPCIMITGSGKRLGKALALEFAKCGWDIIIHYNNSEQSAEELMRYFKNCNFNAFSVKADLRSRIQIESAFDTIKSNFLLPDVLVNNAGIYPSKKGLSELTEQEWDSTFDINLKQVFLTAKCFAEMSIVTGRIINIGSLGGQEIWNGRIPYNVSKAGLIQLTKVLAVELAPKISVNCVSPGTILLDEEPSEPIQVLPNTIPMQRFANVNDIFEAVYFFATCTNYISGQCLNVDGAYHLKR